MDGFDGDCLNDTLIGLTTPAMLPLMQCEGSGTEDASAMIKHEESCAPSI
jgi:hypothetical protein